VDAGIERLNPEPDLLEEVMSVVGMGLVALGTKQ